MAIIATVFHGGNSMSEKASVAGSVVKIMPSTYAPLRLGEYYQVMIQTPFDEIFGQLAVILDHQVTNNFLGIWFYTHNKVPLPKVFMLVEEGGYLIAIPSPLIEQGGPENAYFLEWGGDGKVQPLR